MKQQDELAINLANDFGITDKEAAEIIDHNPLEYLRGLLDEATARDHEHAIGKYQCLVCFNRRQAERAFEQACVRYVHAILTVGHHAKQVPVVNGLTREVMGEAHAPSFGIAIDSCECLYCRTARAAYRRGLEEAAHAIEGPGEQTGYQQAKIIRAIGAKR
jgi:hypothetical protein